MSKQFAIEVFYSEEDEGYIANIPELSFCSAFGETKEEALKELAVAQRLWLETRAETGSREHLREVLARVHNIPPEELDRL